MTDREVLELAAKAAGLAGYADGMRGHFVMTEHMHDPWNPLSDDGDALRLAVKLKLEVGHDDKRGYGVVYAEKRGPPNSIHCVEQHGDDQNAATRRAITRAAAEIGKQIIAAQGEQG